MFAKTKIIPSLAFRIASGVTKPGAAGLTKKWEALLAGYPVRDLAVFRRAFLYGIIIY